MKQRSFYLEIFLVAFAALLLEISYTRVFSFKVTSYYTYLIIGLALLGIGAGGVFVALFRRLRDTAPERLLPVLSLIGATTVGIGYFIIAAVELSTHRPPSNPAQIARLVLVCLALFSSFLSIGLMIAVIFARRPASIHRLYFADLLGAGLGCAAAIPMMILVSPPGCVFAGGAILALAGIRSSLGEVRQLGPLAVALAAVLGLGAVYPEALPDPVVDPVKTMGEKQLQRWGFSSLFRRWNPVFRVDVLESPLAPGRLALVHDGDWGSALYAFDGEVSSLRERYQASSRRLPFEVAKENPRVLIIGSAGGNEILASLYFGAQEITAVELNPVTVWLLTDHYTEFTGRVAEHEKVTLVNGEGRSFLSRDQTKYDLIYFVAPDSYATMNAAQASGFVLVESYLYTIEMIKEVARHLNPGGVLCMQFGEVDYQRKPNRTARYLSTARKALGELGIADFGRHVLLATNFDFPIQLSTILIQVEPFSERQIESFLGVSATIPRGAATYARGRGLGRGVLASVISLPAEELEELYETYAYDIRPVSDDSPFFWHFARFRDLVTGGNPSLRVPIGPEDGRGESALLIMLLVSGVLSAAFLLLPFATVRDRWARLPHKARAIAYFSALGLGFMFFEIALIQKLTLFLGYPTYTLTVTLLTLLVSSGIGSFATEWYIEGRNRALPVLVGVLIALALFHAFAFDPIAHALVGRPLAFRIALAVMVLTPLGLGLGAFMPLGLATVSRLTEHRAEYVAWGWAVNGVFSVIGSLLATILSMTYGFRAVLLLAATLYLLAGAVLRTIPLVKAGRT
jgi:spermidine synthase